MTDRAANPYAVAHLVLTEHDPAEKVRLSLQTDLSAYDFGLTSGGLAAPDRPARPDHPKLLPPRDMPKRSTGAKGRIALIHALAHIELNAIDLAWDMVLRFGSDIASHKFLSDWIGVAIEEAEHFQLLLVRLKELGCDYGDLPAHDGLWEAAIKTSGDVLDRLAVIPMMLEARGIDTTPAAVKRLRKADDDDTATILEKIYHDEIKHLGVGVYWFEQTCLSRNLNPFPTWRDLIKKHLNTKPKGPFNYDGRAQAAMEPAYWEGWED